MRVQRSGGFLVFCIAGGGRELGFELRELLRGLG